MSTAITARWGASFTAIDFINAEMVADGFAWRYVQYDKSGEFAAAEAEARDHRRGLWFDSDPMPPWEWRKAKRQGSR